MPTTRAEELKHDVEELQRLLASAQRQRVKDLLLIEVRKLETEMSSLRDADAADTVSAPAVSPNKPRCYNVKLSNYAWNQSDKFVKIFVTLKNVQTLEEANVFCTFTRRSMDLNARGLDGRNYQLFINNLLDDIDVAKSYWKVKTDMLVVFLAKGMVGCHWSHMTHLERKAQEPRLPKMGGDDDPSVGLMDMMKQMYEDGDDEMKRTIAKAWTESREKQMAGGF